MLSIGYLTRLIQALQWWDQLVQLPLRVPAEYFPLSGLVWAALGLPLSWGLWKGRRWAARAVRWLALAFSVYIWLDRLVLADAIVRANWPFRLVVNLAALALIYWILSRRRSKIFFGELDD